MTYKSDKNPTYSPRAIGSAKGRKKNKRVTSQSQNIQLFLKQMHMTQIRRKLPSFL